MAKDTCWLCSAMAVGICCSSHDANLCHLCYRVAHFVEICVEGCTACKVEGLPVILQRAEAAS